ncbi:MAG: orotidine-5'-phosphate decarboxylase [Candidatus Omnitrophica bacterium]|nr:orotidine-5'-phosphate decarboxylase [Candidatus Omnitrophota bacterium]
MPSAADRLIVAFDSPELSKALALGRQLRGLARYAKIGSILFTAAGPEAIAKFKALGFEVFLDLKFHDIPSTVEKSCRAAAAHGVSLLTVHAKGRRAMLEAAVHGVRDARPRPKILAVTVLTSVAVPATTGGGSQKRGGRQELSRDVCDLVGEAIHAKCDGIVASAQEVKDIRDAFPDAKLAIVCPGIRPSWAAGRNDQRRLATPAEAMANGADLLVVGRPITEAPDPRAAAQQLLDEMED